MTTAEKYEQIEDGFFEITDPLASDFKFATVGDLPAMNRDFHHAKKWANQASDPENKRAWEKIMHQADIRYREEYKKTKNIK